MKIFHGRIKPVGATASMHFPQVLHYAALHASLIFALAATSASYTRDALVVSIGMHFYVSTTTY